MNTRRGFTLIELLVVIVVSTVLLGAITRILISNQRLYTSNTEQVLAQQTVRAGVEVVAQELREVSAELGDLLGIAETQVQFRAVRGAGIVCAIDSRTPLTVRVQNRGRAFEVGDPVTYFVDNDVDLSADDYWATASVADVGTTAAVCPGALAAPAQVVEFSAASPAAADAEVQIGSLVRAFQSFSYGLVTDGGQPFLGRVDSGGNATPLVGPIDAVGGVRFVYRDAAGSPTATPGDVRTIELTLRATSQAREQGGRVVADSLSRLIHLRN